MLTWAFELRINPYFDGFRTLATNGVDKPVLNFFRMAGLMAGDRVRHFKATAPYLWIRWKPGGCGRHAEYPRPCHQFVNGDAAVMLWNYPRRRHPRSFRGREALDTGSCRNLCIVYYCSTTESTIITAMHIRYGSRWAPRKARLRSS